MKINRNNYEVFVIDFLDGKLNAEDTSALMLFFDDNPDLKEEFEILQEPLLQPEPIIFQNKETLKKQAIKTVADINEDNYEDFFIAYYEADLNQQEKEDVDIFLGLNKFLHEEFELFGKVYLKADILVSFPGKEALKMKPKRRIIYYSVAIAALILLFFSIYPFLNSEVPNPASSKSTQLFVMQKANPVIKINQQVELQVILPEIKPKQIELSENIFAEPEKQMLTVVAAREIPFEDLLSMNYTLRQKNEYPDIADIPEETVKQKKSALGRVLNKNVSGLLAVFKNKKNTSENNTEPVFVKVLDQSLLVFNTITGSDKELTKVYTKDGKLKSYGFNGGAVNVKRQVGQTAE